MRRQDDLVHPGVGQLQRLGVDDVGDGVENVTRRGAEMLGPGRRDADDADPLAVLLDDGRVGDPATVAQRLQDRLLREVAVGRQEGHAAALEGDELRDASGTESYSWLPIVTAS